MRRWASALAGTVILAVAGCGGLPPGVDGDPTDDWPAPRPAVQFRPQVACHAELVRSATVDDWSPVPCAGPHRTETFAVADLPGSLRGRPQDHAGRAFRECSARAAGFLGGDWRTGWLILQPVLPGEAAWSGGARWLRCDLVQTAPAGGDPVRRSGSVRGGLTAGKLRMSCADPRIRGRQVAAMHPVSCAGRHTSEFAGLYQARAGSLREVTDAQLAKGCGSAIAAFTGIPDDRNVRHRVGWLGFPPDDAAWRLGDRAIRCFLWLDGEPMTGSYRDAGTRRLPIHYAGR